MAENVFKCLNVFHSCLICSGMLLVLLSKVAGLARARGDVPALPRLLHSVITVNMHGLYVATEIIGAC